MSLNVDTPYTGTHASEPETDVPDTANWPSWRGPTLDGVSRDEEVATRWSKTAHIVWQAKVPGRGLSSPVVWGERVFLTTADDQSQKQIVLAFDRNTGKQLWERVVHTGGFMRKYGKNSHASATPACDGERLYSVFINNNGLHVLATDLSGKVLWRQKAGAFTSEHGYGSSPVLYKSLVIVNGDNLTGCFVAALDRGTGKVVWRTQRQTTGKHGGYATPVVADIAGRPQLILTGMHEVSSYDPDTGKRIWWCRGPAEVTANTPAWSEDLVFASGGFPEKEIIAVRADGAGDVTNSHIVWRTGKGVAYVPSPLYHAGRLYVINDGGVVSCFEGATGKQLGQSRLPGAFSSSPILSGQRLYVTNEAGKTYVLKADPTFDVIATNDLADATLATPAICGGRIFLRTGSFLYCIQ